MTDTFLYILGAATFLGSLFIIFKFSNKRIYFKKQYDVVDNTIDKKVINWYLKYLQVQINAQLIGAFLFNIILLLFHQSLREFFEEIPGALGYSSLSALIGIFSWILWKKKTAFQKTVTESLSADSRPPVLFLRPFKLAGDAQKNFADYINKNSKKIFTTASFIIGYARLVGPVVGIANPKVKSEMEFEFSKQLYDQWKEQVLALMKDASLIIFRPNNSEGVLWEFEMLFKLGYLTKTVMYVGASEDAIEEYYASFKEFRQTVIDKWGIDIGEHNFKAPIVYFDELTNPRKANDYFDIPCFREAFYKQFILMGKGRIRVADI